MDRPAGQARNLQSPEQAPTQATSSRRHDGLLTAVGLVDILIGLWLIGEPWGALRWLGVAVLLVGVFLVAGGNRGLFGRLPLRSSALLQLGAGRIWMLVLTGLCLISRAILRMFGIG